MWEPVMAPLSVGRRVFAYDLRSHGSAAGSPTPFTMADTAADLVGVLMHWLSTGRTSSAYRTAGRSRRAPPSATPSALRPWPC